MSALKKKRPGLPMDYFLLHQDNASPHTAESTRLEINLIGFGTVSHPPYSPDLAPMDFSVFPTIKKQLKGRKFKSLSGLRVAVKTIVSQFDEQWYDILTSGYSATADAFCTVGSTLRRSEIVYLRQRDPVKQMTSATSPWDACRAPRRRRVLALMNDIFLITCANCLKFTQRKEEKQPFHVI